MLVTKYKESIKNSTNANIKNRALTGLTLTERERAKYILFLASTSEAINFLKREVKTVCNK